MPKSAFMRIIQDPDSDTGFSVAIMIKNVRPKKLPNGSIKLVKRNFMGCNQMDVDGYKVKPRVEVNIWCPIPVYIENNIKKKKALERAIAKSPMLI
jgi:hypothetical protein